MGDSNGDIELSNMKNGPTEKSKPQRMRRRRTCCCVCCGAFSILLILIVVVLVILAFTVFKPKKPRMHVDSITLESFKGEEVLNIPPSIMLNVTLGLVVSVSNPNKFSFKFHNSTAHMFYRDTEVGIVPTPSGELGAGKTIRISSSLELLADRLITDGRVYVDFFAGSLPFSTRTEISGRVNILNVIKHHVDTFSECDMTISVAKADIENMTCKYDYDY